MQVTGNQNGHCCLSCSSFLGGECHILCFHTIFFNEWLVIYTDVHTHVHFFVRKDIYSLLPENRHTKWRMCVCSINQTDVYSHRHTGKRSFYRRNSYLFDYINVCFYIHPETRINTLLFVFLFLSSTYRFIIYSYELSTGFPLERWNGRSSLLCANKHQKRPFYMLFSNGGSQWRRFGFAWLRSLIYRILQWELTLWSE